MVFALHAEHWICRAPPGSGLTCLVRGGHGVEADAVEPGVDVLVQQRAELQKKLDKLSLYRSS